MANQRISEETRERIASVWESILGGIAEGNEVRAVLAVAGVSRGQVRAYLATVEGAREQWDDARLESGDAFMDEALAATRATHTEYRDSEGKLHIVPIDATLARARADTAKWAARTRNPRVYSEKQQLTLDVRTLSVHAIVRDADARLLAAEQARQLGRQVGNVALLAVNERVLEHARQDAEFVSD